MLFYNVCKSQSYISHNKYYIEAGIGPIISLFGRSKPPFNYLNLKEYVIKKGTLGKAIDFEAGINLKKNWSISFQFSDQQFSNRFNIKDTIINTRTEYNFEGNLYRHQQYYQLILNKVLINKPNKAFGIGLGAFFVNSSEQIAVQYSGVRDLSNASATLGEYPHLEAGGSFNFYYEHKANKNVIWREREK